MRVLGMISGTSHDGIDVAVVDFELVGSVLEGRVGHTASTPYPDELRARLIAALPPAPTTLAEVCELDTLIGQSFAEAAIRPSWSKPRAFRPLLVTTASISALAGPMSYACSEPSRTTVMFEMPPRLSAPAPPSCSPSSSPSSTDTSGAPCPPAVMSLILTSDSTGAPVRSAIQAGWPICSVPSACVPSTQW